MNFLCLERIYKLFKKKNRKDADENNASKPSSNDDGNGTESTCKSIRIGKQYACSQCSYSADKKVSLNRHMRMHQTSPTPSSVTSNGDECPTSQVIFFDPNFPVWLKLSMMKFTYL